MNWNLEYMTFAVLIICAARGALMALVSLVCEIVRMTPWYKKCNEEMSVRMAEDVINKNYIQYTCPSCSTTLNYSHHIENYCPHCGHAVTEEEKKKYEKV